MIHPTIRPIADQATLELAQRLAQADGHFLLNPSHVVQRNGEIIGAFSVARAPMLGVWMHSSKVGPRDSVHLLASIEDLMANAGAGLYVMPCEERSPYYEKMEKLGFVRMGACVLFMKALGVPVKQPEAVAESPGSAAIPFPAAQPEPVLMPAN